jgi:hypothetical protein
MVPATGPSIATQYKKMHFGSPCGFGVLGVNTDPRGVIQTDAMFPEKPSPDVLAYADIPVAIGAATPENEFLISDIRPSIMTPRCGDSSRQREVFRCI